MINQLFDNVFLINLDRRPDRLQICDDWFKSNNINYERISAVDGKTLEAVDIRKAAELGCKLSHLKVVEMIHNRGYDNALILEDDFEPVDNFFSRLGEAAKWIPQDWDQLYFGGNHQFELRPVNDYIFQTKGTATTHAYAIRGDVYPFLVKIFEHPHPVDSIYRVAHSVMKAYTFTPCLIKQKDGFSDVVNTTIRYQDGGYNYIL